MRKDVEKCLNTQDQVEVRLSCSNAERVNRVYGFQWVFLYITITRPAHSQLLLFPAHDFVLVFPFPFFPFFNLPHIAQFVVVSHQTHSSHSFEPSQCQTQHHFHPNSKQFLLSLQVENSIFSYSHSFNQF